MSEAVALLAMADPFTRFCWEHLLAHGSAAVRELVEASGSAEWWPVKAGLEVLRRNGLAEEDRTGRWRLTEFGRRVRDVSVELRSLPVV